MRLSRWFLPLIILRSAVAAGAILTPPGIPEQPLIRSIYNWGDAVAVVTENYVPENHTVRYSLGIVDDKAGRIVPFSELKCGSYDDIGYSEELGKVLACSDGGVSHIYRLTEGSWKPVSDALPGDNFRIAVVSSRPEGLVIGKAGDIYIAMRSLGVLVFHKSEGRYDTKSEAVRQVLF